MTSYSKYKRKLRYGKKLSRMKIALYKLKHCNNKFKSKRPNIKNGTWSIIKSNVR